MFATTSEPLSKGPTILLALLCLAAAAGIPRLVVDPEAPFRGDPESAFERTDRALREGTGGDDVVAVVLWDRRGRFESAGLAAVDAVHAALLSKPALLRSRSFTRAPLLVSHEGVLTAATPLHPLPAGPELVDAFDQVLADPFAAGTLVTPDGSMAMLPSWVRRESVPSVLVGIASSALQDADVRAAPEGAACKQAVDQGRLAVVLGESAGPADVEVARRLTNLATSGNSLAKDWLSAAERQAADPDQAALDAAREALDSVSLPEGVTGVVLGEGAVQETLAARFPIAVALALLGVLAGVGLVTRREGGALATRAVVSGVCAAGAVAGGMGWVGAPLHSFTALAPLCAALVAGLASVRAVSPVHILGAVAPLLALAVGGRVTPGLAPALLLLTTTVLASNALAPRETAAGPVPPRRVVLVGAALVLLCAASMAPRPLGLDPSGQIGRQHPLGAAMHALDHHGMATPAQIALVGDGPRALAAPDRLRALRGAQDRLEAHESVSGTVSWADFVRALHGAVSGAEGLPTDPALVDQYLLLFGRPEDVRPLVAADLGVGGGVLRMAAGEGAHLGPLAGEVSDGVMVVGGAARVSGAGHRLARSTLGAGGLGLLIGVVLLGMSRREGVVLGLAAGAVAMAVTTAWSGAVGFEALLAAGVIWALAATSPHRMALAGLFGVLALATPVVSVAALAVGVASGAAVTSLLGRWTNR